MGSGGFGSGSRRRCQCAISKHAGDIFCPRCRSPYCGRCRIRILHNPIREQNARRQLCRDCVRVRSMNETPICCVLL